MTEALLKLVREYLYKSDDEREKKQIANKKCAIESRNCLDECEFGTESANLLQAVADLLQLLRDLNRKYETGTEIAGTSLKHIKGNDE